MAGSVLPVLFSARPGHSLCPLFLLPLHCCSIQPCLVDPCMPSVRRARGGQRWRSCRRNLAAWSAPPPSCRVSAVTVVWTLGWRWASSICLSLEILMAYEELSLSSSLFPSRPPDPLPFFPLLSFKHFMGAPWRIGITGGWMWRRLTSAYCTEAWPGDLFTTSVAFYWTNTDCDHWVKGASGSHDKNSCFCQKGHYVSHEL